MALNAYDQSIYDAGYKYIPQSQYLLNPFQIPQGNSNLINSGIASINQPYLYPYPYLEGGDGGFQGGGKFGNLDLSQSKNFMKDVYSRDLVSGPTEAVATGQTMPTASFKPEMVQGFLNPNTGQYQTYEGKNINHLGMSVKPLFATIMENILGKKDDEDMFDYPLGSIKGTFTGYDPRKNLGILETFRKNKARNEELKRMQEEAEAAAALAAQRDSTREADAAAGAFSSQVQQDSGGGGSWREQTAAKERQGVSVAGPGFGKGAYFMNGGLVNLVDIYD